MVYKSNIGMELMVLMKRIAIDMDEVMADSLPKLLTQFNEAFGQTITIEETHGKLLTDIFPDLKKDILTLYDKPDFFRDLNVMKDSQEVIKELSQYFEIYITTAAMEFPTSFMAKYEWLREHFSFLSDLNFVFCGDKSILHSDYLIDDSARHFERFTGQGILFTAPHNMNETRYVRVNNWEEVRNLFYEKSVKL